GCPWEPWC
uniref:Contryphan-Le n=1 Tax=Conus leopardus TaxID=101306 RepID=COWA_CONLE|nr:RecName: Full=Contryphan-Le [Conus leopardus]